MLKRRDFIKFGLPAAAALMFGPEKGWTSEAAGPSNDHVFKTPFYRVALSATGPEITAMSFDSLGHGGKPVNPIMPVPAAPDRQTWHVIKTLHSVTYRLVRHGAITSALDMRTPMPMLWPIAPVPCWRMCRIISAAPHGRISSIPGPVNSTAFIIKPSLIRGRACWPDGKVPTENCMIIRSSLSIPLRYASVFWMPAKLAPS